MCVYFCLVVGSVVGVSAFSVCTSLDGLDFFSAVYYLLRASACFHCVQFVFGCSLVWFWTHWRTGRTAAACRFCALRSSGFRGEYQK